ncbi:MAG: hypothetical protein JSW11_15060 [Candidatus Heimdallarchaeota archaeon]|nr:MAG: hypothetical protein JSW11_15060 [Candidatus Heimdallarchaeota archaeon]
MFSAIPIIKPVATPYTQQKMIKKHDIHFFWVKTNPDELQSLPIPSLPLKEEEVYILINQALRKIFLWVGLAAPARSKFVGAHAANVIQRRTGIVYRVENVDQRSKSTDFRQTLAAIEA